MDRFVLASICYINSSINIHTYASSLTYIFPVGVHTCDCECGWILLLLAKGKRVRAHSRPALR